MNEQLIHQTNGQLEATIYHEYLHAILGAEENHGPTFQAYEASGLLMGGNEMDALSSMEAPRLEQENPADVERLEAILDGHLRMIQYLQSIHDAQ